MQSSTNATALIAKSDATEVEKALLILFVQSDQTQPVSVSDISTGLESAGHAKINRSRLSNRLAKDSRCTKYQGGFRLNARKIASVEDVAALYLGPTRPRPTSHWLDGEILSEAPKYIREVIDQINVTYAHSCFDACSVMVRRLVETLLVESFEAQKSLSEITNANGDLVTLKHLIERSQKTNCFTISRQTKNALPRLKDIGDWSAHNRRYLGKQSDLDRIQPALRLALSDLGHIAGMVR